MPKSEERDIHSHFHNIHHRYTQLLCMFRSTKALFKTVILPNIWLIWLYSLLIHYLNFNIYDTQSLPFSSMDLCPQNMGFALTCHESIIAIRIN